MLKILSEKYDVTSNKIHKKDQRYPIISVNAYENCICAEFYGYVNEDGSPYKEHYYQIGGAEIVERIKKQIESYSEYQLLMDLKDFP